MGDVVNVIAVILFVAWAVGFFALNIGGFIHVFLVIALIAVLFRVFQRKEMS